MPYIKYRLILEKYLMSDDESEDEHKVLHKYPPIGISARLIKDSSTDNSKYRKLLREDMYRKIDDMCVSLEEQTNGEDYDVHAADVAPVVYAKWENGRCTNCHTDRPIVMASVTQGYMHQYQGKINYCPNCGAKIMEEK